MLPSETIDVIFTKLSLYYGRDFLGRWEGLDLAMVKGDWAHELSGIRPQAVLYALQNLPARAPHVGEFKQIALRAPAPQPKRLERPRSNPELVKTELNKARELLKRRAK